MHWRGTRGGPQPKPRAVARLTWWATGAHANIRTPGVPGSYGGGVTTDDQRKRPGALGGQRGAGLVPLDLWNQGCACWSLAPNWSNQRRPERPHAPPRNDCQDEGGAAREYRAARGYGRPRAGSNSRPEAPLRLRGLTRCGVLRSRSWAEWALGRCGASRRQAALDDIETWGPCQKSLIGFLKVRRKNYAPAFSHPTAPRTAARRATLCLGICGSCSSRTER